MSISNSLRINNSIIENVTYKTYIFQYCSFNFIDILNCANHSHKCSKFKFYFGEAVTGFESGTRGESAAVRSGTIEQTFVILSDVTLEIVAV